MQKNGEIIQITDELEKAYLEEYIFGPSDKCLNEPTAAKNHTLIGGSNGEPDYYFLDLKPLTPMVDD